MPEFIMPLGDDKPAEYALQWQRATIGYFAKGYFEAMFFTDCEHGTFRADPNEDAADIGGRLWNPETQSNLPGDVTFAELAPETLAKIQRDCEAFQTANAALLETAAALEPGSETFRYARNTLDDTRLGQLFWYARNGHGVSFEDDGNAPCLYALQEAAHHVGQADSYLGDDGLIYLG